MELPKKGFILPDGIILDCFGERHCIRATSYIECNCREKYNKSVDFCVRIVYNGYCGGNTDEAKRFN